MSKRFSGKRSASVLNRGAIAGAAVAAMACASAAQAGVVQFTGGDPGEGITLSNPIYAVLPQGGPETIQGVTFSANNSHVTFTYGGGAFGANYVDSNDTSDDASPTANDNALSGVLGAYYGGGTGVYSNSGITVAISGLTASHSYTLNFLVATTNGNHTENFAFNGGPVSDTVPIVVYKGYDVTDIVAANTSGDINVAITGFTQSTLNAVVVTPAPEPATLGILGIGALGLLRRKRRA